MYIIAIKLLSKYCKIVRGCKYISIYVHCDAEMHRLIK